MDCSLVTMRQNTIVNVVEGSAHDQAVARIDAMILERGVFWEDSKSEYFRKVVLTSYSTVIKFENPPSLSEIIMILAEINDEVISEAAMMHFHIEHGDPDSFDECYRDQAVAEYYQGWYGDYDYQMNHRLEDVVFEFLADKGMCVDISSGYVSGNPEHTALAGECQNVIFPTLISRLALRELPDFAFTRPIFIAGEV